MQQLPLPDLNKRTSKTAQNSTNRPNKPIRLIQDRTRTRSTSTATMDSQSPTLDQPNQSVPPGGLMSITEIDTIDTSKPSRRSDPSDRSDRAEITSLFDLLGIGTSIATSVTLGVCGYYAHELIDPEVDVALLPEIPTSDETGRLDRTRLTSLADVSGNVAIATPEFLPSLRNETRQWGSDLHRFVRALQAPRATPKLALANRELAPQYPANPTIERWLDRTSGVQSDPAGERQIYLAKTQAMKSQFTAAIVELQKIPPTSPNYDIAQTKITEYSRSRDVRARVSLQVAYDLAAAGDFSGSLAFLNEIPAEASIYATVQQKRLEYTQKRDVQAKTWLYRAKNLAAAMQYGEAIAVLRVIPQGTSVYGEAKQKILEYHQISVVIEQQRLEEQKTKFVPQPEPPEAT